MGFVRLIVTVLWMCCAALAIPERMHDTIGGRSLHLRAHGSFKGVSECARQARRGHCRVYECLEDAFEDCPEQLEDHITKTFCEVSRQNHTLFTHEGKQWAKRTSHCVLLTLALKARTVTCVDIDMVLDDIFDECAAFPDICDVIESDYQAIYDVFSGAWMQVVKAARDCPREVLDRFVQRTVQQQMRKHQDL